MDTLQTVVDVFVTIFNGIATALGFLNDNVWSRIPGIADTVFGIIQKIIDFFKGLGGDGGGLDLSSIFDGFDLSSILGSLGIGS